MSNGTAKLNSDMPDSEKAKIRDIFIKYMKELGFINIRLDPNNLLKVDYDINPEQDFVKEICDDLNYEIVKQKSTRKTKKMYQKIKKIANKMEKACQTEALLRYFKGNKLLESCVKDSGLESYIKDAGVDLDG